MAPPPSSLRVNGCTKPERLAATMPFRTWFALGLASGLALVTGLGLGLGLGIGLGLGLGLGLARVIWGPHRDGRKEVRVHADPHGRVPRRTHVVPSVRPRGRRGVVR